MKRHEILIVFLVVLALSAVFWLRQQRLPAGNDKRLQVGYVSSGLTGLAIEVMKQQGIASRHDLDITLIGFANPQALNQAFFLGQIEVNVAAGANVVASKTGDPPNFVYFYPTLLNTVSVLVKTESSFQQLTDLKGKKIAWYGPLSGGGYGVHGAD